MVTFYKPVGLTLEKQDWEHYSVIKKNETQPFATT